LGPQLAETWYLDLSKYKDKTNGINLPAEDQFDKTNGIINLPANEDFDKTNGTTLPAKDDFDKTNDIFSLRANEGIDKTNDISTPANIDVLQWIDQGRFTTVVPLLLCHDTESEMVAKLQWLGERLSQRQLNKMVEGIELWDALDLQRYVNNLLIQFNAPWADGIKINQTYIMPDVNKTNGINLPANNGIDKTNGIKLPANNGVDKTNGIKLPANKGIDKTNDISLPANKHMIGPINSDSLNIDPILTDGIASAVDASILVNVEAANHVPTAGSDGATADGTASAGSLRQKAGDTAPRTCVPVCFAMDYDDDDVGRLMDEDDHVEVDEHMVTILELLRRVASRSRRPVNTDSLNYDPALTDGIASAVHLFDVSDEMLSTDNLGPINSDSLHSDPNSATPGNPARRDHHVSMAEFYAILKLMGPARLVPYRIKFVKKKRMIRDLQGTGGAFLQAADMHSWLLTAAIHGYEALALSEISHMLHDQDIKCSMKDLARYADQLVCRREAEWNVSGYLQLTVQQCP